MNSHERFLASFSGLEPARKTPLRTPKDSGVNTSRSIERFKESFSCLCVPRRTTLASRSTVSVPTESIRRFMDSFID